MIRIPFTELNKDKIIAEQSAKGLRLVEEQNHFDGKFLIFDELDIEAEIKNIKARLDALEAK